MTRFLFFTVLYLISHSSIGQFADTAQLNTYIRDTIKDKRPEKVTAAQIQKILLGITKFLPPAGPPTQTLQQVLSAGSNISNQDNSILINEKKLIFNGSAGDATVPNRSRVEFGNGYGQSLINIYSHSDNSTYSEIALKDEAYPSDDLKINAGMGASSLIYRSPQGASFLELGGYTSVLGAVSSPSNKSQTIQMLAIPKSFPGGTQYGIKVTDGSDTTGFYYEGDYYARAILKQPNRWIPDIAAVRKTITDSINLSLRSFTNNKALFTAAGVPTTDNLFHWDNTNKVLGLGTATPKTTTRLHVSGTGASQLFIENTNPPSTTGGASILLSTTSLLANGQRYGGITWSSPFIGSDVSVAGINVYGSQGGPGFGGAGTYMSFSTTLHGSYSPQERMRIDSQGKLGINIINPRATVEIGPIPSGSSSIGPNMRISNGNLSPNYIDFDMQNGTLLVTPSLNIFASGAGMSFLIGKNTSLNYGYNVLSAYKNFNDEGSVGTTNTALHSYTIPGNVLPFSTGSQLSFEFTGTCAGSASSKQIVFQWNGADVFNSDPLPVAATTNFSIRGWIIRTGPSTAKITATLQFNGSISGYLSLTNQDFTAPITFRVMGQSSGTDVANNDIVIHMSRVYQSNL